MSSNLYNKALRNIKLKDNINKVSCSENEINENLKKSFHFELKNLTKAIELKKLFPNKLYEFLTKYENNLPPTFFYKYSMELGDVLLRNGYSMIARNQCYERYLIKIHNLDLLSSDPNDLSQYLHLDQEEELESTISAIFGFCLAEFRCLETLDCNFEAKIHQQKCQILLRIYQRVMEIILKYEKYCWLLYNGTVCIYWICETLIRCGCSMIVVEPLMWASCCLETSIPLLTIPNLKWRAAIYAATCQSLFNIQYDTDAEAFARRALVKINELHGLYEMSSEPHTPENAMIICEAVIKMGVMIFKRNAFETRRRPKTYLRPKTKINFKEILQNNWPRTGTERILAEMFDSPSQQILAILEAVKQPSRTIGKIEPAASENDWEMLDVYSELFYAAIAIITGRSQLSGKADKIISKEYKIVDTDQETSQLTLAVQNGSSVTIESAFELVCWAFSYGNWEFIDCINNQLLSLIKDSKYLPNKLAKENMLNLFTLMRKITHSSVYIEKKAVKLTDQSTDEDKNKQGEPQITSRTLQRSNSSVSKETKSSKSKKDNSTPDEEDKTKYQESQDPLCQLTNFLESILDNKFNPKDYYQEILVEAGLVLWTKCKSIFQSTQDGSLSTEFIKPISNIGKWIRVLYIAQRVLSVTNYSKIHPISYAEVSMRLALLLEQLAVNGWISGAEISNDENAEEYSLTSFIALLKSDSTSNSGKCIAAAKQILRTSIDQLNKARNLQNMRNENNQENQLKITESLDDLYLEINSIYLRICARETVNNLYIITNEHKSMAEIRKSTLYKEALQMCNKNVILLAIFQAHLGNLLKNNLSPAEISELINHVKSLLEKSENNLSDIKTFSHSKESDENYEKLPPPVVEKKGNDYIIVKLDSNLNPQLKSKIGWVRLYARAVDTPNAEVRLTDDKLPGTGMETSCLSTQFTIYNLIANQQYILAFSAYDKFGSPIGRGIGHSTKYILATDSINPVSAYAIIAQIIFEMNLKEEVIWFENLLWTHFVEPITECNDVYQKTNYSKSILHNEYSIKPDLLKSSSSMLLRQFSLVVLSSVASECKLRGITNDINAKSHSQIEDQMHRLRLSDKLLTLFAISKKLKDNLLTMEIFASISCLMAPIMNHNQFYKPFSEILIICVNTLHGLPQTTWIKIPLSFKRQIHHLLASIGFYLLKCMNKHQYDADLLESIRHSITILLQMSGNSPFTVTDQEDAVNNNGTSSQIDENNDKIPSISQKKFAIKVNKNDNLSASISSQQTAFELFKFALAKQNVYDHQLTGNEEPDILMAYISNLPSRIAYKEVSKFSRKTRYLQFIVEILNKAMIEGNFDHCFNYYKEIKEWLRKRNEAILGKPLFMIQSQINREANKAVISDKDMFSRSVVTHEDVEDSKKPPKPKRKTKYKAINIHPNMNDTQRQIQEQAELKALEVLSTTFVSMYKQNLRRKKFRQISEYERAARIKMTSSMGMGYLGMAYGKIDAFIQLLNGGLRLSEIPEIQDITKFMLDGTGKILQLEELPLINDGITVLKTTKQQNSRQTDTPRTYRSDINLTEKRIFVEAPKLLSLFSDSFNKAALVLKRSIVLANRGKNWLLLSHACSLSWYCLSLFINISCRLSKFLNLAKKEYPDIDWSQIQPVSLNSVYKTFSGLFYFGSDGILDMIGVHKQNYPNKPIKHFDENFLENYVLRSVHLLFETGNYEKSIHIILRFTKLTNYQFVNVTHPVLINSQEQLCRKAAENQARNPDWTVEICQKYINQSIIDMKCNCIDASNYQEFLFKRHSGLLSLKKLYQQKSKILNQIQQLGNENSHIQNLLQVLKSEASSILIFSVPIDIDVSNKEWLKYQSEKSPKKSWMELYHKKNYFYFIQTSNHEPNKKGSKLNFQELLNSYKEQLDESLSNNNLEHYSLTLRDMGDLYINHLKKPSLALPLWNESLDCIFDQKQAVKAIISLMDEPTKYTFQMEKFLSKFGAINCLVIGSLLTKICRLDDVNYDERIKMCLQAATFFKAVYSSSFSHPENDMSYLDHSLFLDSVISTPLIPKMYLFANSSLIDIQDLESQLYFLINLLIQTEYYQFLISLLALYEHLVYTSFRNSTKSIEVQIIKLKICIKFRRFSTASRLIFQLFTGDKLPQITDSRPAASVTKTPTNIYDDRKQLNDENNLIVLDKILSRRINTNFSQKIGSSLTNKISLLQAEFLMELSACIPVAAEILNPKIYSSTETSVMSSKKQTSKKSEMVVNQIEEESHSLLESVASNTQRSSWNKISLPVLKGLLLQVSSSIIQPIIDDYICSIQKEDLEYLKMNIYEVENTVDGLLLQSKNYRLRFFNRSGARLSMFACCLLRDYFGESINLDNKSARTVSFLNIFYHMKCSQELVQCMLGELSVGNVLDISDMAISDVPTVQELIMSCIEECDQNNLYQHKAWFVGALAQYALITGYEIHKYREILSEGMEILNGECWLSDAGENVLIDIKLRFINANISSNNVQTYDAIKHAENSLRHVHRRVLELVDNKYPQSVFWNTNDCDLSSVKIYNVYDWKYVYLSKINLLFGSIFMLKTQFVEEKNEMRFKALTVLNIGLDFCRSLSRREPWVEAEFLLMIGRIQRIFIMSGKVTHATAISTLVEGLKLSLGSTGHLGMKKQFFLELSITFMICSQILGDSVIFDGEIVDAAKLLINAQTAQALQNQKFHKTEAMNFRRLSWLAIKCATSVSDSLQNLNFYKSDSSKVLSQDAQTNFPNSALFDLFGRYTIGDKRIVFKNEIEEELSRMPESRILRDNEHIDDQIERIRGFLSKATLSQILAYQELLLKLTNNIFLSKSEDFELKIKPLTRCVFNDDLLFEKENEIHKFLNNYVNEYKMKCTVIIPRDISNYSSVNTLEGVGDNVFVHLNKPLWNSVKCNEEEETSDDAQKFFKMNVEYPADILLKIEIKEKLPIEKMDVSETEIFMHFYDPPFEFNLHSQSRTMLIYASTKKVLKSVNKLESALTGWLLIPSQDIFLIYRDLQESAQLLEILSNSSESTFSSKSSEGSKKQISSTTNSSSLKQSKSNNQQLMLSMGSEISAIEIKIRQTFDKISSWIIKTPTIPFSVPNDILIKTTEHTFTISTSGCVINPISFELTKENIRILANLFNPILSKPINNNSLLTKFIHDIFKIDF